MTDHTALAKSHYSSMLSDFPFATSYARVIREFVKVGTANWDKLGFTDADVSSRWRSAMVLLAQKHYRSMQEDRQWAPSFAAIIRDFVKNGTTSWEELGFTDADVTARLLMKKVA